MMKVSHTIGITLLFLATWTPALGAGTDATVKAFLDSHCVRCHGPKEQEAELALHEISLDFADAKNADRWLRVLEQLTANDMPPAEEKKHPTETERDAIIEWIELRLLTTGSGEAWRKKLLAPEYGNWVNHEKLFSGEIDTPPFSPARLWRFSPELFRNKGLGLAQNPYTHVTSERGIRDYAAMSMVDQSTVQMPLLTADQWLEKRQAKGEFKAFADDQPTPSTEALGDTVRREFRRVVGREPGPEEVTKYQAYLARNIKIGGNLEGLLVTIKTMFLSKEAIYRMEFGLGPKDDHGRRHLAPQEIAYALAYALTDLGPERTKAIQNAHRESKLAHKEDVARVVRQMLDEEPRHVPRIMRFFDEFFGFNRAGSVFKDDARKRREGIEQWNTGLLIRDARMLIGHVLEQDKDVIAQLLTTNKFFVAHPGDNDVAREYYEQRVAEVMAPGYVDGKVHEEREKLTRNMKAWELDKEDIENRLVKFRKVEEAIVAKYKMALEKGMTPFPRFPGIGDIIYVESYNFPGSNRIEEQKWAWPLEQPFEMPKGQRAGLLTHPAWLAAHSLNDGNDPIHRGIWIREKLLAGVFQDVPPDVDAQVPPDPHKTLRERLGLLRDERCWTCHRKFNPLGESFEIFDDWGRHRTHHYFDEDRKLVTRRDKTFQAMLESKQLSTRPVNASGSITGSGDAKVDGEVDGAIELMQRLGHSDRARQSFIRHVFRYFMGRNEMLSDSKTLIEAERAYLDNGGSFKALVVSLLSSDSFLYRR